MFPNPVSGFYSIPDPGVIKAPDPKSGPKVKKAPDPESGSATLELPEISSYRHIIFDFKKVYAFTYIIINERLNGSRLFFIKTKLCGKDSGKGYG